MNAPTVQQIMDMMRKVSRLKKKGENHSVSMQLREEARQNRAASKRVNKVMSLLRKETYGQAEVEKLKDVLWLLFEDVNSLGVFLKCRARDQKLK